MPRSITRTGWIVLAASVCLAAGCFSGGYEKDFQARLQEYKRAAAGEPPVAAAEAEAEPAAPPAEAAAE